MSPIITKKKNKSYGFTIGISLVVLVMLALIAFTIASSRSENVDTAAIQVSSSVSVVPATVEGETGSAALPPFDEAAQANDPAVGQLVPQFTGQQFDEKRVTIGPEGKPYVLVFLAHWCQFCQSEVPKLVALESNGDLPDDVEFIAVTTATTSAQQNYPPSKWLLREEWPWKTVLDSEASQIANAYGLAGYPFMVFVNADGTVAERTSGVRADAQIIASANSISTNS